MKRCGACGRQYRGAGKRAIVGGDRKLVCPTCAGGAILVVATSATCSCGAPATKCGGCARTAEDRAKTFDARAIAKQLRKRADTYKNMRDPDEASDGHFAGLVEGLESAATLLESGRW